MSPRNQLIHAAMVCNALSHGLMKMAHNMDEGKAGDLDESEREDIDQENDALQEALKPLLPKRDGG